MDKHQEFLQERICEAQKMAQDESLKEKSIDWMIHADKYKYTYNYSWLGRPIIKFPNDILAAQEIIWKVKPDLIIETGIAHGGSIIFSASMIELLGNDGLVIGVDIDIREHNRKAIEGHPMSKRIKMIEGSSTDEKIINQIAGIAKNYQTVMVFLDSLHTHEHVLKELELYSPFVTLDSYMVLPDTFIEFFPKGYYADRPWDVGDNPYTALKEFMKTNDDFVIDYETVNKLGITEAFDGYLLRVK
ncbi:MAG: cephalosporin hydroxylase family protein [Lachnospiraceae bacterium]|nr:cephalosporin hydroxylase family protein [Lachnospiraceae bacterium]